MRFLIPIVSALLFRAGGSDQWKWCPMNQKLWRWLMGAAIGLMLWKGWLVYALTIGLYFLTTNLFGYGDKTPILKYLPKPWKFACSGFAFGLASIPLLGWWGLLQGIVSGAAFYGLYLLDEADIVKNPWQELLRGALGTICYL